MAQELLQATGIAKQYGSVIALRNANLSIHPGESHALLGANGAGKSTFVKILTGVINSSAGQLSVDSVATCFSSPAQARQAGIASVFQDPALVSDLTVAQNLRLTGTPRAGFARALDDLGITGFDPGEQIADISLPFLRMFDLARALAHQPRLLVLDEITAALPTDLADRVFDSMRRHTAAGGSVLFISHRLEEIIEHCGRCTVFRDGRDVATFVPREGGESRIVQSMLGDSAGLVREEARRSSVSFDGVKPQLEVRSVAAGEQLADVSFAVRPGEVVAVVALEGQGQDTLFEGIAGAQKFDSGEVLIGGNPLSASHPAKAIARGVAFVPSDRAHALLPQRPISENLALPLFRRTRTWGPIPQKTVSAKVTRTVERLSIDTRAASQARRLSGGNQQKLTIGRWLTAGFDTLLLFDPTRGIDIGTKHQIYDLIRDIADEGAAVLMYTSELREVNLVADRAVVLYRGRMVAELAADVGDEALLSAAHGFTNTHSHSGKGATS
ncbi:MAG: ABC transporter [Candidatus Lumbricidophila eiseniae]|uniref:ABC transporter n=1 Tax=Candidatus Lumbricidiphila eiseniae TaxID=1969409 RepID=A0A2A6FPG1_9MICO|nr:MAG: ABC transporter [Candidatus Lumbricidophila eiseniae]